MNARRFPVPAAWHLLLAAICGVYFVGAFRAVPFTRTADRDFDLMRSWRETGRLTTHPSDPSHLTKPGAIALLRMMFPRDSPVASHARRFVVLNASLMVAGIGLSALALRRTAGPASSFVFLVGLVAAPQLRDACDYVASEAVATGLVLVAFGATALGRFENRRWGTLLGVCAGLLWALRPNVAVLLVAVAAVMAIGSGRHSRSWLRTAVITLAGTVIVIYSAFSATGYRPAPGATARVLLWGTADYYWRPDAGGWPTGRTPGETARLQGAQLVERWRSNLRDWNENQRRSLEWKALHGFVSSEELPPQWIGGRYQRLDRKLREWWWLTAAILAGLSLLAASGGRGPYRYIGVLAVAFGVLQSVVFGADPRLALPLLPLLAAGIAGALPALRWSAAAIVAGTVTLILLVWRVSRVPDAAGYDFALVRGHGRRIEQLLPPSLFPASGPARVHFRLYEEPPYVLGIRASIGGALLERRPLEASGYPAFFSVSLTGPQTAEARSSGAWLSIESIGPPGFDGFFYFPLIPPVFGHPCRVDGDRRLPSGFAGLAEGGLPVWVTTGDVAAPEAR